MSSTLSQLKNGSYDGIILAGAHDEFSEMGAKNIKKLGAQRHVLYDLKYAISSDDSDLRL